MKVWKVFQNPCRISVTIWSKKLVCTFVWVIFERRPYKRTHFFCRTSAHFCKYFSLRKKLFSSKRNMADSWKWGKMISEKMTFCQRIFFPKYFVPIKSFSISTHKPTMSGKGKWKMCRTITKKDFIHNSDNRKNGKIGNIADWIKYWKIKLTNKRESKVCKPLAKGGNHRNSQRIFVMLYLNVSVNRSWKWMQLFNKRYVN